MLISVAQKEKVKRTKDQSEKSLNTPDLKQHLPTMDKYWYHYVMFQMHLKVKKKMVRKILIEANVVNGGERALTMRVIFATYEQVLGSRLGAFSFLHVKTTRSLLSRQSEIIFFLQGFLRCGSSPWSGIRSMVIVYFEAIFCICNNTSGCI